MAKQQIRTKYHSTGAGAGRVKATCGVHSITIPYEHSSSATALHDRAAKTLAEKMGWSGELVEQGKHGSHVYALAGLRANSSGPQVEVIFRKSRQEGAFALFPYIIETLTGDVAMYSMKYQHASAYYNVMIKESYPCPPEDAAIMKRHLEQLGYGSLKEIKQMNRDRYQAAWDKLRRERARR